MRVRSPGGPQIQAKTAVYVSEANGRDTAISLILDRESPCHVKLLRTQKVVYISCGEEHTAVLTKVRGLEYSSLFHGAWCRVRRECLFITVWLVG